MQEKDFEGWGAQLLLEDARVTQEVPGDQAPRGMGDPVTGLDDLHEGGDYLQCGCCFSLAPFDCLPH